MCILHFFKVYEILFENHILYQKVISINNYSRRACSVADADLQIRGGAGGGGGLQPLRKGGGAVSKKKIVRAPSGTEFGLQIREAPPLDPPLALDMRW